MPSTLDITLLGPLAVHIDGKPLHCASKKTLWMAAYLLLTKATKPRAEIAALFWGGGGTGAALGSLRVALTKLPAPMLESLDIQRDRIGAAAGKACEVDAGEFLALCDSVDSDCLARAVELYQGDLFEGIDAADAPEFSDWLFVERARLRQHAQDAHLALAVALRARGDGDGARRIADKWLRHQPADEAMHRLLMTWLADDVGHDRALAQFEVYRRALAVSAGAAPSVAMKELAESFRQRHTATLVRPRVWLRAPPSSVAKTNWPRWANRCAIRPAGSSHCTAWAALAKRGSRSRCSTGWPANLPTASLWPRSTMWLHRTCARKN